MFDPTKKHNDEGGGACGKDSGDLAPKIISRVPLDIQENLKYLVEQFPEGLLCNKLDAEYLKMFTTPVDIGKYNYDSMLDLCLSLPNLFGYEVTPSGSYVYCKTLPPPKILERRSETTGKPLSWPEVTVVNSLIRFAERVTKQWSPPEEAGAAALAADFMEDKKRTEHLPTRVMANYDKIPDAYARLDIKEDDCFGCTLGEVIDPSLFYVTRAFGEFSRFMSNLQTYFATQTLTQIVPSQYLEAGLYCVVRHSEKYCRAVILKKCTEFCIVFLFDFGTVAMASLMEVWFMPVSFGRLEAQAIRCCLANIAPISETGVWSPTSVLRFQQLLDRKELVATLVRKNEEEHSYEIYLGDATASDMFFYINDVLVEEGHAVFCAPVDQRGPIAGPSSMQIEFDEHPYMSAELNRCMQYQSGFIEQVSQYFNVERDENFDFYDDEMDEDSRYDIAEACGNQTDRKYDFGPISKPTQTYAEKKGSPLHPPPNPEFEARIRGLRTGFDDLSLADRLEAGFSGNLPQSSRGAQCMDEGSNSDDDRVVVDPVLSLYDEAAAVEPATPSSSSGSLGARSSVAPYFYSTFNPEAEEFYPPRECVKTSQGTFIRAPGSNRVMVTPFYEAILPKNFDAIPPRSGSLFQLDNYTAMLKSDSYFDTSGKSSNSKKNDVPREDTSMPGPSGISRRDTPCPWLCQTPPEEDSPSEEDYSADEIEDPAQWSLNLNPAQGAIPKRRFQRDQ